MTWDEWIAAGEATLNGTAPEGVPTPSVSPNGGTRWTREAIIAAIQRWAELYGEPPKQRAWSRGGADHPSSSRVKQVFETWSAAIVGAGFLPPKRGGRVKGQKNLSKSVGAGSAGGAFVKGKPSRPPAEPNADPLETLIKAREGLDIAGDIYDQAVVAYHAAVVALNGAGE